MRLKILLFMLFVFAMPANAAICNGSANCNTDTVSTWDQFDACLDSQFATAGIGDVIRCKFKEGLNLDSSGEHTYTIPAGTSAKLQVFLDFDRFRSSMTMTGNDQTTLVLDLANSATNLTVYRNGGIFDAVVGAFTGWGGAIEFVNTNATYSYNITGDVYDGFSTDLDADSVCFIHRGDPGATMLFMKWNGTRPKCDMSLDSTDAGNISNFIADGVHWVPLGTDATSSAINLVAGANIVITGGFMQSNLPVRLSAPNVDVRTIWGSRTSTAGDPYSFEFGGNSPAEPTNFYLELTGGAKRNSASFVKLTEVTNGYITHHAENDALVYLTTGPYYTSEETTGQIDGDVCAIVTTKACTVPTTCNPGTCWADAFATAAVDRGTAGAGLYLEACGQTLSYTGAAFGTTACPSRP